MATHSSIIAWKIPWTEEPGRLQSMGLQRVGHDRATLLSLFKKQQLEPDMEQQTGSKMGKEYIKAVYGHPAYFTHIQMISCKMLGWMKHKLESRLPGEISITSDM